MGSEIVYYDIWDKNKTGEKRDYGGETQFCEGTLDVALVRQRDFNSKNRIQTTTETQKTVDPVYPLWAYTMSS